VKGHDHLVFVQTNNPLGNQIAVCHRAADGALTRTATVDTGGNGGRLGSTASDPLASQGSLVYDSNHHMLFAVNAGSNTISVLTLDDDHLCLRQVLSSNGTFPVSLTVHRGLLYVLNAREAGSISGYKIIHHRVSPIPESSRSLNLQAASGPTQTPAQISFTPDGRHLVITTKANGSHIDVFNMEENGQPSDTFTANPAGTPLPFGFTFDQRGHLVVTDARTSSLSTYMVHRDGSITQIASQTDGQRLMCWVAHAAGNFYVTDNGSDMITGYHIDAAGTPTVFTNVATGGGPTDLAVTGDGHFLYAEVGTVGNVDAFRINSDGTLIRVATLTGLPNLEGIVAL
jgi:6-phosphogluconolactonase (cycloisomerase 2 family)